MLVASNTSPICNLAIIGRLNLLRAQFGQVWIPNAVKGELDQLTNAGALRDVVQAIQLGWIKARAVQDDKVVRLLAATLDAGEAEAIALGLEMSAGMILLDERDGRIAAERAGLRVTGVLGVLLRAKRDCQIEAVKPELESLRTLARFFVSPSLEARVLATAGE